MKLMVGLIQYNDLYDVMVGLKQVRHPWCPTPLLTII